MERIKPLLVEGQTRFLEAFLVWSIVGMLEDRGVGASATSKELVAIGLDISQSFREWRNDRRRDIGGRVPRAIKEVLHFSGTPSEIFKPDWLSSDDFALAVALCCYCSHVKMENYPQYRIDVRNEKEFERLKEIFAGLYTGSASSIRKGKHGKRIMLKMADHNLFWLIRLIERQSEGIPWQLFKQHEAVIARGLAVTCGRRSYNSAGVLTRVSLTGRRRPRNADELATIQSILEREGVHSSLNDCRGDGGGIELIIEGSDLNKLFSERQDPSIQSAYLNLGEPIGLPEQTETAPPPISNEAASIFVVQHKAALCDTNQQEQDRAAESAQEAKRVQEQLARLSELLQENGGQLKTVEKIWEAKEIPLDNDLPPSFKRLSQEEEQILGRLLLVCREIRECLVGVGEQGLERLGDELLLQLSEIREAERKVEALMVYCNKKLACKIAHGWFLKVMASGDREKCIQLDDLIQEGYAGLLTAARRWDYRRGTKFSTYATWWIRQKVSMAAMSQGPAIRLPRSVHADRKMMAIEKDKLRLRLGRSPDENELAGALRISPQKLRSLETVACQGSSLQQPIGGDGTELEHIIEDRAVSPPPLDVERLMLERLLAKLLEEVSPREARILELRFGLRDGQSHTLEEVGQKFGYTRERVRQIEAHALQRLRHPSRTRQLRDFLD